MIRIIIKSLLAFVVVERQPEGARLYFLPGTQFIFNRFGVRLFDNVSYFWLASEKQWINEKTGAYIRTPAANLILNGVLNQRLADDRKRSGGKSGGHGRAPRAKKRP